MIHVTVAVEQITLKGRPRSLLENLFKKIETCGGDGLQKDEIKKASKWG